jgi:transcriptional regulator with PAS, ATPase and Fis domain
VLNYSEILNRFVGDSDFIHALRARVARIAQLNVPVLVTGETGTGKELVARCIHDCSVRRSHPFVAVNCGALSDSLLESDLFGHERGAFTGATVARRGFFEEAAQGTILLDEIGEISPRLQVTLLRVLETQEFLPVGSSRSRRLYCRVIAATNADLDEMARTKRFRMDLLYRVRRLSVGLLPLRHRKDDILPLVAHFLSKNSEHGRTASVSAELKQKLMEHSWPGNVRELHHRIEQMQLIAGPKDIYDKEDFDDPYLNLSTEGSRARLAQAATDDVEAPSLRVQPIAPTLPDEDERVAKVLSGGPSRLRRLGRLRSLFLRHPTMTRGEIQSILGIPLNTLSRDLKALCEEGFIIRKEPSASPRSFYFELRNK